MKSIFAKSNLKSNLKFNLITKNKENSSYGLTDKYTNTPSYNEIYESIPPESVDNENPELAKYMTEYRWRFYDNGIKKFVEISYKKPNENRIFFSYKNEKNNWFEINEETNILINKWEKYIIETKYCYTNV
jgi:hypothetical protein